VADDPPGRRTFVRPRAVELLVHGRLTQVTGGDISLAAAHRIIDRAGPRFLSRPRAPGNALEHCGIARILAANSPVYLPDLRAHADRRRTYPIPEWLALTTSSRS